MIKREEETRRHGRSDDNDLALRRFNEEIRTRGSARPCVVFNDLCCDFSPKIAILLCHHKIWYVEESRPGQTDQVQRYFCPRCCSSFSKKANMLTHFRYECGKEPRFQCPYCGKRDRKSSNTYRHIRTYHKDSRIQAYKLY